MPCFGCPQVRLFASPVGPHFSSVSLLGTLLHSPPRMNQDGHQPFRLSELTHILFRPSTASQLLLLAWQRAGSLASRELATLYRDQVRSQDLLRHPFGCSKVGPKETKILGYVPSYVYCLLPGLVACRKALIRKKCTFTHSPISNPTQCSFFSGKVVARKFTLGRSSHLSRF